VDQLDVRAGEHERARDGSRRGASRRHLRVEQRPPLGRQPEHDDGVRDRLQPNEPGERLVERAGGDEDVE
jgi:hypothetical protein